MRDGSWLFRVHFQYISTFIIIISPGEVLFLFARMCFSARLRRNGTAAVVTKMSDYSYAVTACLGGAVGSIAVRAAWLR